MRGRLVRVARDMYRGVWYDMAVLQHPWAQPCGLVAAFVKLSLAPLIGDAEAQRPEGLGVPATYKLTLTAILLIHCVAEPDVIGVTANSLGERPLEAVGIVVAFRAAHPGVTVSGTIVGDGGFGEVVPPFAGRAVGEEGVGVREEGGVREGFLL